MYKRRYSSAVVPYGQRRFKRRYPQKRSRFPMYRSPAKTSASFARQVRRVVSAERKFHYLNFTTLIDQATPAGADLTRIAQGVANNQRIGNWIQPTSMHGTYTVRGNSEAEGDTVWNVRIFIMVYVDSIKDLDIIPTEFMQDSTRPGGPFNILRKGQFSVLYTKFFTVSNNSDNNLFSRTFTWRLNLNKLKKILFDGDESTDGTKGHIFFQAVSDSASPVSLPPSLTADNTFRYTDS